MKQILGSILFLVWLLVTFVLALTVLGGIVIFEGTDGKWMDMGKELLSIVKSDNKV
jgi:hypothetical protein